MGFVRQQKALHTSAQVATKCTILASHTIWCMQATWPQLPGGIFPTKYVLWHLNIPMDISCTGLQSHHISIASMSLSCQQLQLLADGLQKPQALAESDSSLESITLSALQSASAHHDLAVAAWEQKAHALTSVISECANCHLTKLLGSKTGRQLLCFRRSQNQSTAFLRSL